MLTVISLLGMIEEMVLLLKMVVNVYPLLGVAVAMASLLTMVLTVVSLLVMMAVVVSLLEIVTTFVWLMTVLLVETTCGRKSGTKCRKNAIYTLLFVIVLYYYDVYCVNIPWTMTIVSLNSLTVDTLAVQR